MNIFHLVVEDSIDERVVKALKDKTSNQDELMEAVKARLDQYKSKESTH